MRPVPFEYLEPVTVEQACAALTGRAVVLAGGQSLVARLNTRESRPDVVVAIGRIAELTTIELADGILHIGAAVTQRAVQQAPCAARVPVLLSALDHVGHVPTRNRGTVGGSIAFADPAAELPVVLLALGGSVTAASSAGTRTVAASELFLGAFRTTLDPGELLTSVRLPLPADGTRWAFAQRDFRRHAKVSVVAGGDDDGLLTVAVAGVTDRPVLLADASALLEKAGGTSEGVKLVADAVADLVTPNTDPLGSVDYRRQLAVAATVSAVGRVVSAGDEVAA
ncbi:FAD binding domain-containing protein [Pseudonocardia spinosispora]|uniref:FAD binding domain-containing protein n=1 Tax=Pseudonocardia spinosispora TaxID=103441 RepID=UPI0004207724|nr:FAD binding domain-containing protein [Pseudonocardia spinosispora]